MPPIKIFSAGKVLTGASVSRANGVDENNNNNNNNHNTRPRQTQGGKAPRMRVADSGEAVPDTTPAPPPKKRKFRPGTRKYHIHSNVKDFTFLATK